MLDYELIRRPGLKQQVPDAISRIAPVHKEEDGELVPIDDDIPHYDDPLFVVSASSRQVTPVRGIGDSSTWY